MKKLIIHKKENSENTTNYFFTKTKNICLRIEYNKRYDFGEDSTSGVHISKVEMHYQNAWKTEELQEIKISDVPKSVIDILSFLN